MLRLTMFNNQRFFLTNSLKRHRILPWKLLNWVRIFSTGLLALLLLNSSTELRGQCKKSTEIWNELRFTEDNSEYSTESKLSRLTNLKSVFEKCKLPADSVYARILHRIALYEFLLNHNSPTSQGLDYTLQAARINLNSPAGSRRFAVNSYSNLAIYYRSLMLYKKSLDYFDSTIALVAKYPDQYKFLFTARQERSNIFFHTGNYQQSIDEGRAGLIEAKNISDTSWMINFLTQMAQSHYSLYELAEGIEAADKAIAFANTLLKQSRKGGAANLEVDPVSKRLFFELATALKAKALIYEQLSNYSVAEDYFQQTIRNRINSVSDDNFGQVAGDYNDFGNFYLNSMKSFHKATSCYSQTLVYAKRSNDPERMAKAYLNLGQSSYQQQQFKLAQSYYVKSLNQLLPEPYTDFLRQPISTQLNRVVNNEFILVYLRNRIELLLTEFKTTGSARYLEKALQTAYLSDTLITRFRHEQTGERTQLFWREQTRGIYTLMMEVAYLKHDLAATFFFMEKSRAVLLNDKLNELGSFAYLPTTEALKEQELRNEFLSEQQEAAMRSLNRELDEDAELRLLKAKEDFSTYIKSLEKKYPAYYQYKYSDSVPSLADLKHYLAANKQSFVHYFVGDTVSYAMSISGDGARMLRIESNKFRPDEIPALIAFFSNKQLLNNQYSRFASQSYRLYKSLFEPLQLPAGRVVVCPDNFLLPFEALSTNGSGKKMLIDDYAFTYIYSARYLLKQFPQFPARGNFLGFAPVSFQSYLQLADLKSSAASLDDVAENYNKSLLYKATQATRQHFLSSVGNYDIVNIFSHARADEANEQPMLFMQDSVIRLSELQYLNRPCTRLVVLSACQTTAGKNATGEGIYSLARGFAAAGIPSVAATIWKADEEAIYSISKLFHQHLSKGEPMDVALQKAKLAYIQTASREQLLPYYWANMVIIGKVDPLVLEKGNSFRFWYIGAFGILAALIILLLMKQKAKHSVDFSRYF